jgi:hypothetical protein
MGGLAIKRLKFVMWLFAEDSWETAAGPGLALLSGIRVLPSRVPFLTGHALLPP